MLFPFILGCEPTFAQLAGSSLAPEYGGPERIPFISETAGVRKMVSTLVLRRGTNEPAAAHEYFLDSKSLGAALAHFSIKKAA